jgi:hypothetical protein
MRLLEDSEVMACVGVVDHYQQNISRSYSLSFHAISLRKFSSL